MKLHISLIILLGLLQSCSHSPSEFTRDLAQGSQGQRVIKKESFWQSVERNSIEQVRGFSDETLVDQLNSPDWSRLWKKSTLRIEELERRIAGSKDRALGFTNLFLDSFFKRKDMQGNEVQHIFLHTFSQAGPPEQWTAKWEDLGRRLERLDRMARHAEDRNAASEAKKLFRTHFVEGAKLKTSFQGKKSYLDFLQNLSNDSSLAWVAKDADFELIALVNHLFELGTAKEYPVLFSLYDQFESQLDRGFALEKLFTLNPKGMSEVVAKRINLYSENDPATVMAFEIDFLRRWSPRSLPTILPKVYFLVKSAEAKKDMAGKAALLAAIGVQEGKKEMTWAQLYPGRLDRKVCLTSAEILSDFYRRKLMKSNEVVKGIQSLADCNEQEVREKLSTIIVSLCKEARKQKDATVLGPCVKELFYPMALWSLRIQSKVAKENARELFELIPEKWKNALPRKCRVGMLTPNVYSSSSKIIRKEELNYFYLSGSEIKASSCRELDSSQLMFLSKKRSGSYLQKEGKGVDFLADLVGDSRLQMSSCFLSILSDPKFPGMVAKLAGHGKDRARNITFLMEEYAEFPEAKGGFVDSCSR